MKLIEHENGNVVLKHSLAELVIVREAILQTLGNEFIAPETLSSHEAEALWSHYEKTHDLHVASIEADRSHAELLARTLESARFDFNPRNEYDDENWNNTASDAAYEIRHQLRELDIDKIAVNYPVPDCVPDWMNG